MSGEILISTTAGILAADYAILATGNDSMPIRETMLARPVRGGHLALISLNGDLFYLVTYDAAQEALYARHAARTIRGILQ